MIGAYSGGVEQDWIRLGNERLEGVVEKIDALLVPEHDHFYDDASDGLVHSWERAGNPGGIRLIL